MKRVQLMLCSIFPLFVFGQNQPGKSPEHFIPAGYGLEDKVSGDLNKDGLADCVLLIRATDITQFVTGENGEKIDRNRRGLVVLFKKKDGYRLVLENKTCFLSANEEGGVYYPPELSILIKHGKLIVYYAHGRYGYWSYSFRNNTEGFELVGYDAREDRGPVVERIVSINFLTGKKFEKVNTNENAIGGDEIFRSNWSVIPAATPIYLSGIDDFNELDVTDDR